MRGSTRSVGISMMRLFVGYLGSLDYRAHSDVESHGTAITLVKVVALKAEIIRGPNQGSNGKAVLATLRAMRTQWVNKE